MRDRIRLQIRAALKSARASIAAMRQWVHPDPANLWITEAQLRLGRANAQTAPILIPVAAFFVALACANWVSDAMRTGWWIAVAASGLAMNRLTWWLQSVPTNTLEGIRLRVKARFFATTAFSIVWCSMTLFLWAPGEPLNHMLLIMVLACSLAGSVASGAAQPATMAALVVVHGVFMLVPTLTSPDTMDRTLGGTSAVFLLLMISHAISLHGSMNKLLRLEHERADLVQGLKVAKEISDRERAQAAAAGRAKSQFLSNMNHELRTPMNAILGFSELIKTKAFGDSVDKYTEYAEIIHDSGQHLLGLINDMLDLAKIEGGRLSLRESDVNMTALINDVLEASAAKAAEGELTITKILQKNIPRVRGDERGLRQIVANLVSNSLKFTPRGGRVEVFSQIDASGRMIIRIADNGIGIAEEDRDRVFERFGQGRHDITSHERGTGLGLAIVKGFAEAHDGSVSLESELGHGTTVTVTLPAERVLASPVQSVKKAG